MSSTVLLDPSVATSLPLREAVKAVIAGTWEDLPDYKLSQAAIARRLGLTPPVISSWLGGKYTGDTATIERKLADLLMALMEESRQERDTAELFSTDVTSRVRKFLATIKEEGYIGTIYGPPGLGKTSGIAMYLRDHSLDIGINLNRAACPGTASGLVAAFWACRAFNRTGYKASGLTRSTFVCKHFAGQKRMIIVDNAHLLCRGGVEWLVGFHESTGCPIALVGNREVTDAVARSERAVTHIGFERVIDFADDSKGRRGWESFVTQYAKDFAEAQWPEYQVDVIPQAERVIRGARNVRNLRSVSQLARMMHTKGAGIQEAFQNAMDLQGCKF